MTETDLPSSARRSSVHDAVERPPNGRIVLHVAAAMIAAGLLTILLHEAAHAVAGLGFGIASRVYPFAAMPVTEPGRDENAVILLAGPAFSLVLGVALSLVIRPRARPGSAYLFGVWFAYTNILEGAGYLIFTPFGIGDTGMVAAAYGVEMTLGWVGFIAGLGIALLLAIRYARRIVPLVPAGDLPRLRALSFYPWMIGVVVAILLSFAWMALADIDLDGGSSIAVAVGGIALGVWAPMAMPFTVKARGDAPDSRPLRLGVFPTLSAVIIVVVIAVNIALLPGPVWG